MKLETARPYAEALRELLAPHCERIEIAGSVRRCKPEVGDIELVAIPKLVPALDLFADAPAVRSPHFADAVLMMGTIEAGNPTTGKYVKIMAGDENPIQIDLFCAVPENWGWIFALRTGSADFSHRVFAAGLNRVGLTSRDGMIQSITTDRPVHCREERDLFALIGVPFVEPERRL